MTAAPVTTQRLYRGIATLRRGYGLVLVRPAGDVPAASWRLGDDFGWGPDACPARSWLALALLADALGSPRAHRVARAFEREILSRLDPDLDWHVDTACLRRWSAHCLL